MVSSLNPAAKSAAETGPGRSTTPAHAALRPMLRPPEPIDQPHRPRLHHEPPVHPSPAALGGGGGRSAEGGEAGGAPLLLKLPRHLERPQLPREHTLPHPLLRREAAPSISPRVS